MAYKQHELDPYILELLKKKGEMRSKDIYTSMPEKERILKRRLGILKKENKVSVRDRFYYSLPIAASTSTQTQSPDDQLKKISKQLRTAEDNEVTISELLNAYDVMQRDTINDLLDNIRDGIDLEQRAFYLDTLKVLALVVDRLMKRWSLVHHGYDTNTRQAQEDAKVKAEERQKQELAEAPLEDKIVVVGHYHPDMQEVLRSLPKKELEDNKV